MVFEAPLFVSASAVFGRQRDQPVGEDSGDSGPGGGEEASGAAGGGTPEEESRGERGGSEEEREQTRPAHRRQQLSVGRKTTRSFCFYLF